MLELSNVMSTNVGLNFKNSKYSDMFKIDLVRGLDWWLSGRGGVE